MKGFTAVSALLAILAAGTAFAAEDGHDKMHEMMMKGGHEPLDKRTELKLPETMKVMQKALMRMHLNSIADMAAAFAEGDLKKTSSIARGLGWSAEEEKRCKKMGELSGEKDFLAYGMAMHRKADEVVAAADAGDAKKAISAFSVLIKSCNSCHERFRH